MITSCCLAWGGGGRRGKHEGEEEQEEAVPRVRQAHGGLSRGGAMEGAVANAP